MDSESDEEASSEKEIDSSSDSLIDTELERPTLAEIALELDSESLNPSDKLFNSDISFDSDPNLDVLSTSDRLEETLKESERIRGSSVKGTVTVFVVLSLKTTVTSPVAETE